MVLTSSKHPVNRDPLLQGATPPWHPWLLVPLPVTIKRLVVMQQPFLHATLPFPTFFKCLR